MMADAKAGEYQSPSNTAHRKPLDNSPGAFRIGALRDPMQKQYLKSIFYGAPGTGKTTLTGSAVDVPELQDVLMITAEGGVMVLDNNPRIQNSDLIDMVPVQRIEQLNKLYEFLKYHCQFRDAGNEAEMEKLQRMVFGIPDDQPVDRIRHYRTVIIDSLTEIEAQNLNKVLDMDSAGLDAADELPVAGFAEFRKNNNAIQRIVRTFRDLPLHVLIICAQQYNQDELKRYHYQPALTGKLSTQIQGFVDIVGWMVVGTNESGQEVRRLVVQPHTAPKADAKNRFASYKSNYFEDPTMASIMRATGFLGKKA